MSKPRTALVCLISSGLAFCLPAAVSLSLSPATVTLSPGQSVVFKASVSGASTSAVTWKTTGGTLTRLCPTTARFSSLVNGTFSITAVSVADPKVEATASAKVLLSEQKPVISSFASLPSAIVLGKTSLLSWSASGATSLQLNPGGLNVTGQTSITVQPTQTTTYTLMAHNAAGSVSSSSTVTVHPAPTGPLGLWIEEVGSNRVKLHWKAMTGATEAKLLLSPEPLHGSPTPGIPLKTMATLSGEVTEFDLKGLAAHVQATIGLEITTPQGKQYEWMKVKTLGGPRAQLDSPLREVHGFAPNILQIVLAEGDGASWAQGPWSVRRANGRELKLAAVYRHSVPVEQPEYNIGWGAGANGKVVRTDHRIYLKFEESIGSPEILSVQGPNGLTFTLPFSDRYLETPVLQVNQVSYHPRATRRYAYVFGWMGDGGALPVSAWPTVVDVLRETKDGTMDPKSYLTSLPVHLRVDLDASAGAGVADIDLASLQASETDQYRVRIPGVGVSWPICVSEKAFLEATRTIVRGLFHNRWGGDLSPQFTFWSRPQDHAGTIYTSDNPAWWSFHPRTPQNPLVGPRKVLGGYHDAGDFDQRPTHTVVPQKLMRAFEVAPSVFEDGSLRIPESGNGIPDLLDEALWGVSVWEQLQEEDGGVRAGIESIAHPNGYYFANEDRLVYWTYGRNANVTARAAGLFAQASRLVKPYDGFRAEDLKQKALKAWNYATKNGASPVSSLYGASELFRLTNDPSFRAAFESCHASFPKGFQMTVNGLSMSDLMAEDNHTGGRATPDYVLGYLMNPNHSESLGQSLSRMLDRGSNIIMERAFNSQHGHRHPRVTNYSIGWGDAACPGRYLDYAIARLQLGQVDAATQQKLLDCLSLSADYVLGCNPLGMSFITGLGSRSPQEPLHLDSLAFIKQGKGPISGIPIFGPIDSTPANDYYQPGLAAFHPSFGDHPRFLKFGDLRSFVRCTEFTVASDQAPHAEHFVVLAGLLN